MANTNSNLIANPALVPPTMNPVGKLGGRVRIAQDNFEVTGTNFDAVADTIKLARLPAGCRPISIKVGCEELDSNATPTNTADLGILLTSGAVVAAGSDAVFIADSDIFQADNSLTEEMLSDTDARRALIGARLWEWAGLTVEPAAGTVYDIAYTSTFVSATAADGTVAFQILYTVD
jgi:hypothetical protein